MAAFPPSPPHPPVSAPPPTSGALPLNNDEPMQGGDGPTKLEKLMPEARMSKTPPTVTTGGKRTDEEAPTPDVEAPEALPELDAFESPHAKAMRLSNEAEMAAGKAALARREQRHRDELALGKEVAKIHAARLAAQEPADHANTHVHHMSASENTPALAKKLPTKKG